jgi:hypothetical protein
MRRLTSEDLAVSWQFPAAPDLIKRFLAEAAALAGSSLSAGRHALFMPYLTDLWAAVASMMS